MGQTLGADSEPVGSLGLPKKGAGHGGGAWRVIVNGAFVHSLAHTLPRKADG